MAASENRTFVIIDVLNEAWSLVRGSKWPIWAIAIGVPIVSMIIQLIITGIFQIDPQNHPPLYRYFIMPIVNNAAIAPFVAGSVMVAIKRARDEPVDYKSGYHYFRKTGPLMLTMAFIAFLGNALLYIAHLPPLVTAMGPHILWLNILAFIIAILVYVFFLLSVPLIVDRNLSPWGALATSFRIIKHCWFKTLILILILYALFIVTMIPFYVGAMIHPYAKLLGALILIGAVVWLAPFLFLVQGMLYHKLVD